MGWFRKTLDVITGQKYGNVKIEEENPEAEKATEEGKFPDTKEYFDENGEHHKVNLEDIPKETDKSSKPSIKDKIIKAAVGIGKFYRENKKDMGEKKESDTASKSKNNTKGPDTGLKR